jgi:hypothetical protein
LDGVEKREIENEWQKQQLREQQLRRRRRAA